MLETIGFKFTRFFSLFINETTPANKIKELDQITKSVFGCIALGAVGDTLGFGSGHSNSRYITPWELCGDTALIQNVINKNFQGNYRNICFKDDQGNQKWVISDDTILHFMQAQVAASDFNANQPIDKFIQEIAKKHVQTLHYQLNHQQNERFFGFSTQRTWNQFKDDPVNWKHFINYNSEATGCAGTMRGMVFGLIYPGENNQDQLVKLAVNAAFLTNPSLVSALGTLASASFTSFALADIAISDWIPQLMINFQRAYEYLNALKDNENLPKAYKDLIVQCLNEEEWEHAYECWNYFYEEALKNEPIPSRENLPKSFIERDCLHKKIEEFANKKPSYPNALTNGDRADTSIFLAFHGLLAGIRLLLDQSTDQIIDSQSKPSNLRALFSKLTNEKKEAIVDEIVQFTVIHGGDCDSTGGIALSLYGSIFGIEGVEEKHVFQTEIAQHVYDIAVKIGSITKQALSRNAKMTNLQP
ncbi:MAG: ADP-ribosylglycohydrolase family protein [Parachlamydiaceae bacterium]|nr:ADP-ribosylglycohydrolase family protein [Parachlamydiaceae bacterium]